MGAPCAWSALSRRAMEPTEERLGATVRHLPPPRSTRVNRRRYPQEGRSRMDCFSSSTQARKEVPACQACHTIQLLGRETSEPPLHRLHRQRYPLCAPCGASCLIWMLPCFPAVTDCSLG